MELQDPGVGIVSPAYLANSVVPPVRAHDAAVDTAVPAVAVYATPKSLPAWVDHAVAVSVRRYPGDAWCRDNCRAVLTYGVGRTLVQNVSEPDVGNTP